MRTQLAAYREEICRLHHANGALAESNRILLDAMTTMRMEHAVGMQRLRGEMAPGFSWPNPNQSALVERYKTRVEELEAEARALRLRYEHQNLSGKARYTRKRSRVSEDMTREAGDMAGRMGRSRPKRPISPLNSAKTICLGQFQPLVILLLHFHRIPRVGMHGQIRA